MFYFSTSLFGPRRTYIVNSKKLVTCICDKLYVAPYTTHTCTDVITRQTRSCLILNRERKYIEIFCCSVSCIFFNKNWRSV
ncbi:hypothetical protein I7I50_03591 [Histoplasma capsulatum G186AR]|uniref:Uncharacterized protein n=1 Tax=Ajellomyces capsulatus TaxID=5037 RepID=A0A8H7YIZ8_AJECA|nr:hypothetical protein I7I52_04498 [Histoplasma capsulatum]QSS74695.1 hypothetical protein I7I50_03591 [Histoplasma capsulatum G186AR]